MSSSYERENDVKPHMLRHLREFNGGCSLARPESACMVVNREDFDMSAISTIENAEKKSRDHDPAHSFHQEEDICEGV